MRRKLIWGSPSCQPLIHFTLHPDTFPHAAGWFLKWKNGFIIIFYIVLCRIYIYFLCTHKKKVTGFPSPAGMSLIIPGQESLVCDIPAGEGKIANLFYSVLCSTLIHLPPRRVPYVGGCRSGLNPPTIVETLALKIRRSNDYALSHAPLGYLTHHSARSHSPLGSILFTTWLNRIHHSARSHSPLD